MQLTSILYHIAASHFLPDFAPVSMMLISICPVMLRRSVSPLPLWRHRSGTLSSGFNQSAEDLPALARDNAQSVINANGSIAISHDRLLPANS